MMKSQELVANTVKLVMILICLNISELFEMRWGWTVSLLCGKHKIYSFQLKETTIASQSLLKGTVCQYQEIPSENQLCKCSGQQKMLLIPYISMPQIVTGSSRPCLPQMELWGQVIAGCFWKSGLLMRYYFAFWLLLFPFHSCLQRTEAVQVEALLLFSFIFILSGAAWWRSPKRQQ